MANKNPLTKTYIIASVAGVLLLVADQLSKYLVEQFMTVDTSIRIIPGFFSITYIRNRGAAFGILQNHRWVFISITMAIVVAGILVLAFRRLKSKWLIWAAALVVSGGIGNLIDRIFIGYVRDMIDVSFMFGYIFNLADACVVIGGLLIIIFIIMPTKKDGKSEGLDLV